MGFASRYSSYELPRICSARDDERAERLTAPAGGFTVP